MNQRLDQFMKAEGLTSAKFAEILSVQPSSISHLLSGRNNPNFDFISKLLLMFPRLNPHWIINGYGDMYIDDKKPSDDQFETHIYKSDSADIFPEKPTEISDKSIDIQVDKSVKSVMSLPDLFVQNPVQTPQPQPESVAEQPESENLIDVNTSQSIDKVESSISNGRAVERVLLLYSDNTFEFFNR